MKKKRRSLLETLIIAFVSLVLFTIGAGLLWASSLELPDFNAFSDRKVAQSTKIYDRTGKVLLYDVNRDLKRTVVPLSAVSRNLKNAIVAIEDDNFYNHRGIEPTAMLRAVFTDIFTGRKAQGGSTITQQVVKNTLLTQDKAYTRKIKEIVLALKLEQVKSKDEILELYLNEAPFGGSIYGVEEAATAYFGVHASDLTLAQAAYLAALPQAPTYYSPYGKNRDALNARKNLVLSRMELLKFADPEEVSLAKNDPVLFVPQAQQKIKAPHFVMYVKSLLEKKYGADVVETGGLKVTTTLNWDLEQMAEDTVTRFGAENAKNYNASNAGLVAIDPKTGQIQAMVGSRDYFNKEIDGSVNVTLTHRQPGSSFKPFVYATALKKGYTPETVLFDLKTQFDTSCPIDANVDENDHCYEPENYDGIFRGPISLRNALAQSINIPAIKVLYLAGIKDSIATAHELGIRGLSDPNRYGLTLVLGGGEVSPLDMTGAYGSFANDGVRNEPTPILEVLDRTGATLEHFTENPSPVLDPQIARTISDILSDNTARTPSYGASSPLLIPGRDVAVKTGTTNDYKDAWIIGYAPNLAVGVWAGNNNNTPMKKKVAGFIVAPLWHDFMVKALATLPKTYFPSPEPTASFTKPVLRGLWQGNVEYVTDKISGGLATDATPAEFRISHVLPDVHTILHWVDKDNPRGPAPAHPENDPQYKLWERPIEHWLSTQHVSAETAPASTDNVHLPEYAPLVGVLGLLPGDELSAGDTLLVTLATSGHFPASVARFFINGSYVGESKNIPFQLRLPLASLSTLRASSTFEAVVYDSVRNKTSVTIPFSVKIHS